MRKSNAFLSAGAALLLTGSAVSRFAILPAIDQLPASGDLVFHLAGTANALNPPALASGDVAHAFLTGLPVTGTQHITVTSTRGKSAVVSVVPAVNGVNGLPLTRTTHIFAVDRVTLEPAAAPVGSKAEQHTGLTGAFPISPRKRPLLKLNVAFELGYQCQLECVGGR